MPQLDVYMYVKKGNTGCTFLVEGLLSQIRFGSRKGIAIFFFQTSGCHNACT